MRLSAVRCEAGATVTPAPCGNASVYCSPGSVAPQLVLPGLYSAPPSGALSLDDNLTATDTMSQALDCPPGFFCMDGVRVGCPPGTYNRQTKRSSVADCLACLAGAYCGKEGCSLVGCL
jgi:hypothetical protein